jgi:hypothetical protein
MGVRHGAQQGLAQWRLHYILPTGQKPALEKGRLIIEALHERLTLQFRRAGSTYFGQNSFEGRRRNLWFLRDPRQTACARGTNTAIWMLPLDMKQWPEDGEIDIMNAGSLPHEIVASLHTGLFNHHHTQRSAQKMLQPAAVLSTAISSIGGPT